MNKRFWVSVIILLLLQAVMGYFGFMHLLPANYSLLTKNVLSIGIEALVTAILSLLVFTLNTVLADFHQDNLQLRMDKLKNFNEKIDREIEDTFTS